MALWFETSLKEGTQMDLTVTNAEFRQLCREYAADTLPETVLRDFGCAQHLVAYKLCEQGRLLSVVGGSRWRTSDLIAEFGDAGDRRICRFQINLAWRTSDGRYRFDVTYNPDEVDVIAVALGAKLTDEVVFFEIGHFWQCSEMPKKTCFYLWGPSGLEREGTSDGGEPRG